MSEATPPPKPSAPNAPKSAITGGGTSAFTMNPPGRWILDAVQRRPIRSLFFLGAAVGMVASSYQDRKRQKQAEEEDAKTKKVLVLPFYKMKLVEESKSNPLSSLLSNPPTGGSGDKTVEMSVDQVVELIHQAAVDPQIVAMYGILGHGSGFATGGWAHMEELRNALLVFQQSHRRHKEPNRNYAETNERPLPKPKPMYLYTNTFASPTPSGGADMKEYYLASAFTHLHLQPQGDLNLFGLHATNTFYRDFLAKYGITVHVWKHGKYKNFANQFTNSSYDQAHAENVSKVLVGIHQHICSGMYNARYEKLKQYEYSTFWQMVHQAGSLPAKMAQRIGFVDFLPPLNPLDDLLSYRREASDTAKSTTASDGDEENNTPNEKEVLETKWMPLEGASENKYGLLTDLQQFPATKPISIMEYARRSKEKDTKNEQQWQVYDRIQKLPAGMRSMLGMMGLNFDKSEFNESEAAGRKEQIAVLKIGGPITDATARKLEKPLRQLKKAKDKVKAVVVRVDSPGGAITACETIHQQLQDLPQKVVVSFGNVSASGGYYISANSERIFASPTTITGSIGVVMLRADLRGLADQWGVNFDSIPTSELSGSYDPFYPMNARMKDNFANFADRAYLHFKSLVSEGRGLDMAEVESVAQGRVWTGEQAIENGLVDELGGLDRAVAYCQRNFTESGQAKVVEWPPKKSIFQAWMDSRRRRYGDEDVDEDDSLDNVDVPSMLLEAAMAGGVRDSFGAVRRLVMGDEQARLTERQQAKESVISSLERSMQAGRLPMAMSGLMLSVDENAAIRCLLEEHEIPDIFGTLPPGFWEG